MHTRGRQENLALVFEVHGTIHAHAGQTMLRSIRSIRPRNHPCTRGADNGVTAATPSQMEPSMHTRGRRESQKLYASSCGTIHAHAGQTDRKEP